MDRPLVIKIKCGEILRRSNAYISKEGFLSFDLATLKKNIQLLFEISPNTDFKLNYIDEDGDEISLVDDNDLFDANVQLLNPLRINVVLQNANETKSEGGGLSDLIQLLQHSDCMCQKNVPFKKSYSYEANGTCQKLKFSSKPVWKPFKAANGNPIKEKEAFSSLLVEHVTFPNGAVLPPNTPFRKVWKLRNNGTVKAWPCKSKLVWIEGDMLSDEISADVKIPENGIPVGKEVDVSLLLKAPKLPGHYVSCWKMSLPTGETFGQQLWVIIKVCDPSENLKSTGSKIEEVD